MSVSVTLPWHLCELAMLAGAKRRLLAMHDGRTNRYGFKESDTWGSDIESAGAECATAWHLDRFWVPWARRPDQVSADVGRYIQVRRRAQRDWDLILHDDDPDDHIAILVHGKLPTYELLGWTLIGHAKENTWGDPYETGRPAYWVPQRSLGTIAGLEEML